MGRMYIFFVHPPPIQSPSSLLLFLSFPCYPILFKYRQRGILVLPKGEGKAQSEVGKKAYERGSIF